jgi:hypothetical protein
MTRGSPPLPFDLGFSPHDDWLFTLARGDALTIGFRKHDDFQTPVEIFQGHKGHTITVFGKLDASLGD